jgi:hypothetical protein
MLCARCQSELGVAAAVLPHAAKTPGADETERDARELLARWSSQNLLEPPLPITTAFVKPENSIETLAPKFDRHIAFDSKSSPPQVLSRTDDRRESTHSAAFIPMMQPDEQKSSGDEAIRRGGDFSIRNHDSIGEHSTKTPPNAHQQPVGTHSFPSNHDQMPHEALHSPKLRRANLTTLVGQVCAYSGVGLLTFGSVLVMWSFFGGPANYMPTGWLTAAVGQMLLFLGVVTLISSGMEQTVAEVTWRIDHLAEEVHHMGLALDDLENEHRQTRLAQQESTSGESRQDHTRKAA